MFRALNVSHRNHVDIRTARHLQSDAKIPKAFRPNFFEEELYSAWNNRDIFKPKNSPKVFSLILPPPNVTGTLHLGHALTTTLLDTIARWKRMCDYEVLWVPGVDHGGISTQVAVERHLIKKGIKRQDLGQTKFLDKVWEWKNEKTDIINMQLKKVGSSVDWTREFFTMSDKHQKAVTQALLKLHQKGLIYRNELLINWSPYLKSVISDIEVEHKEIFGPTAINLPDYLKPVIFGNLIHFAYKVCGSDKEIVVATTRIETMLGDVAIAVNPRDDRYKSFWGCKFSHPFNGTEIPLILDERVDPSFGTGALKITPSHDPADFEISKSHNLPKRSIINEEGVLENCGRFSGLKRFEAREVICNELAVIGLLKDIVPHNMKIPVCSRSGDVIEYLIKPQWFLKCKSMAERAIYAVKERKMIITPENYETNWFHWLENIQEWCISRQLWWGHQLPFYFCEGSNDSIWVAAENEDEALIKCRRDLSGPVKISRDPDVLDTWFSSGILPFTCFGWPEKTEEFNKYYPLNVLVTGNDILFFWVARMVMLSLELTDQLPFNEVFLHGLVCDAQGRKMSKSLGNVIEPEDIINGISLQGLTKRVDNCLTSFDEKNRSKTSLKELFPEGIPECGVDALRFTLLSSNIKSQYINFDLIQYNRSRSFCNKIWQACNFATEWSERLLFNEEFLKDNFFDCPRPQSMMEKWITARLNRLVEEVNKRLENKDFHVAANSIRDFVHLELCDVFIESIKPTLHKGPSGDSKSSLQTLIYSLVISLKCLSPFMPFISEKLYEILPVKRCSFLMETSYPVYKPKESNNQIVERVSFILSVVSEIRRLKHEKGMGYRKVKVWIPNEKNELVEFKEVIETLARCQLILTSLKLEEDNYMKEFVAGIILYFDKDETKTEVMESSLLIARRNKLKMKLDKLMKTSSSGSYKKKAPLKVQEEHKQKILSLEKEIEKLESYQCN